MIFKRKNFYVVFRTRYLDGYENTKFPKHDLCTLYHNCGTNLKEIKKDVRIDMRSDKRLYPEALYFYGYLKFKKIKLNKTNHDKEIKKSC